LRWNAASGQWLLFIAAFVSVGLLWVNVRGGFARDDSPELDAGMMMTPEGRSAGNRVG
jgi:hypothetical protein